MPQYGNRLRFGGPSMFPPGVGGLILVNVAIFLLGMISLGGVSLQQVFVRYGALWPFASTEIGVLFRPWQYITYMFLHGGFSHIFLNMLVLWMFGMELENMWGTRRFLIYYFICGLGAGILHSLVTLAMGGEAVPTVGASGAIMGVMVAFAMAFPDRIIFVSFFLPLRAKYFVLLYAAFDLYNGINGIDGIAHFAHLGGALTGFLLVKFGGVMTLGKFFDRGARQPRETVRPAPPPPQQGARIIDVDYRDLGAQQQPARRGGHQPPVMELGGEQARVDAILDKISHQGYQSLTDEEKAILNEASRRMR